MGRGRKEMSILLGLSYSTASFRLKKNIMFAMMQRLNEDNCYRCGEVILTSEELSVEHKIPWRNSERPKELFWDLGNIAFSHLLCNVKFKEGYGDCEIKASPEARRKMSEGLKKWHANNISPVKGKKHTEETKKKMCIAHSNMSDETRYKMSQSKIGKKNSFYGKKQSKETQQKMRKAWETRAPMTEETKQKMSKSKTGKKHSRESKQRMIEAWKIRKEKHYAKISQNKFSFQA